MELLLSLSLLVVLMASSWSSSGELPPSFIAFLGKSEVLHTGVEAAFRSTLADALAVLPISP